jgi:hypothetical protein
MPTGSSAGESGRVSASTTALRTARKAMNKKTAGERLKNGQVAQQIWRRPDSAVAGPSPTRGGFSQRLRDSQSSPKTHPESGLRHDAKQLPLNGRSDNGSNNTTAQRTNGRRETSAWNLDTLVRPLWRRKQPRPWRPTELPHYPAVAEYIFNNRFATAMQVRERFALHMRSLRTAQYQLAGLVQLGFLNTASVRSTSPNFPAVYFATSRGVRLIASAYERHGRAWRGVATEDAKSRGLSSTSIIHELYLTEFSLALDRALQQRADVRQVYSQRRYFAAGEGLVYRSEAQQTTIVPDLGILLQLKNPHQPQWLMLFLEMDRGTTSLRRVARKIRDYAAWRRSDAADEYFRQLASMSDSAAANCDFRLLWIVQAGEGRDDRNRLRQLLDTTSTLPRVIRDKIWITSIDLLRQHYAAASPLLEPIWIRPVSRRQVTATGPSVTDQPDARGFIWQGRELPYRHLLPKPATHQTHAAD